MKKTEPQPHSDYLQRAEALSRLSPDGETATGCLLVAPLGVTIATGHTDFVRGREKRIPSAGEAVEHAIRATLYESARKGLSTEGTTLYANRFPCPDCAKGIVLAGISLLVVPAPATSDRSDLRSEADSATAYAILSGAGIPVQFVDMPDFLSGQELRRRKIWAKGLRADYKFSGREIFPRKSVSLPDF